MRKNILVIVCLLLAFPVAVFADSAISYTQNSSPALTDEMLGIDDPSGTWSIQRFPLSSIIALGLLDEDNMASDSATKAPSQQSTKAYVDGTIQKKSDCSAETGGCCLDTDDGKLYCWNGVDTMEEIATDTGDTNTQLFEGQTRTALTQDDATPTVASGGLYDCNATGSLTITDFNDGDDHGDFSTGDFFGLYMDSADVTIDFSTNANIEGNANVDFTGSSSQVALLIFVFESGDDSWTLMQTMPGMSSPTELSIDSIPLGEVIDVATATYTTAELCGTILSNSGDTGALEMDFPARTAGWNFTYMIEAAYNVTLDPNGTEQWYLNGTQMAAGEAIVNEAPTVGESISCISTTAAVYCKSSDSDWAEDTP